MANEIFKEIKTKIALKTLSYAEWDAIKDTYKPLKGEVCICTIPEGNAEATNAPTVLLKVGDGVNFYKDLKWASALAADVHAWAKKSETDFITWVNTVVEHPAAPDLTPYLVKENITTGGANGTIAVRGEDVAVKGLGSAAYTDAGAYATAEQGGKADSAAATIATYGDIVTHNASEFAPHDIDTGVHSVSLASGSSNGTVKLTVDGAENEVAVTGLGSAAYVTVDSLDATAKGYADDVQDNLDAYENAHASDYNNAKIDELVQGVKDYADNNDANTEYHVEYDSTNKKIKLVAGADASKMEIDATDFIKDGMIESVELVTEDDGGNKGQFLKITWNTDGDVDADDVTYVNVTTLVDVYVGENGDYVNVTVTSDNKIKADLTDAAKTKLNKVWEEVGVAAGLDVALKTELQKEIDDDIVAYDTSKNFGDVITHNTSEFASSTENGAKELAQGVKDVVDTNKATWDKAGTALQASDLTAYDTSKNFGDIITHNVAEFATFAQGEKADSALQEITTTANNGLKVTNKNNIDIDTDVVFVLDCNW